MRTAWPSKSFLQNRAIKMSSDLSLNRALQRLARGQRDNNSATIRQFQGGRCESNRNRKDDVSNSIQENGVTATVSEDGVTATVSETISVPERGCPETVV